MFWVSVFFSAVISMTRIHIRFFGDSVTTFFFHMKCNFVVFTFFPPNPSHGIFTHGSTFHFIVLKWVGAFLSVCLFFSRPNKIANKGLCFSKKILARTYFHWQCHFGIVRIYSLTCRPEPFTVIMYFTKKQEKCVTFFPYLNKFPVNSGEKFQYAT